MAHELFGERFLGRRTPAWHGLGQTFDEPLTATEAFERAGLDYRIDKRPISFRTELGNHRLIKNRVALVRQPTQDDPDTAVFGIVGPDYGLLQNTELAQMLDPLAEEWPVETVGALREGRTVFVMLDAGELELGPGELLHQYFLLSDTRGGGRALWMAFTPVRVVCANTLSTGIGQAALSGRLYHSATLGDNLELRVAILKSLQQARTRVLESFRALIEAEISAEEARQIFQTAYPASRSGLAQLGDTLDISTLAPEFRKRIERAQHGSDVWTSRMLGRQEAAAELYTKLSDEYPAIAGTAWAAYGAVTELEDWRPTKSEQAARRASLFGDRAANKRKAFEAATVLVT